MKTSILLFALFLVTPAFSAGESWTIPVLCYHQVGTERPKDDYTVSPERLEEEMAWLQQQGYQTISLKQLDLLRLGKPADLPARPIVLSFDDGYEGSWIRGGEVLKKHGFKAVYFLIAKDQNRKNKLSWDQAREIEKEGFEIGSHTCYHSILGRPEAREDVAAYQRRLHQEIFESKKILEAQVHHPVEWLAYPYGVVNPHVEDLVAQAGYSLGFSVTKGYNQPGQPWLSLKRILVMGKPGLKAFSRLLGFEPMPVAVDGIQDGGAVPAGMPSKFTVRMLGGFKPAGLQAFLQDQPLVLKPVAGGYEGEIPADSKHGFRFLKLESRDGRTSYEQQYLVQLLKPEWQAYMK